MSKISSYPSATSLTGTELVPIVQGGVTKKVATSLLASGGAFTDLSATPGTTVTINTPRGRCSLAADGLHYQVTVNSTICKPTSSVFAQVNSANHTNLSNWVKNTQPYDGYFVISLDAVVSSGQCDIDFHVLN